MVALSSRDQMHSVRHLIFTLQDLQIDEDCVEKLLGAGGVELDIEGSLEGCNSKLLDTAVLGLDLEDASVLT